MPLGVQWHDHVVSAGSFVADLLAESDATAVPGLHYVADFVDAAEEAALLAEIDARPWQGALKRRVQHYGYRYDYRARRATAADYLGPIPGWLRPVGERLVAEGHFAAEPEQIIVNEYAPGQGISDHVDCVPCFGDTIASLSLGSPAVMRFTPVAGGTPVSLDLAPRSLIRLTGPARYRWKHGIPARKTDPVAGGRRPRGRRVSLTFRTMILS